SGGNSPYNGSVGVGGGGDGNGATARQNGHDAAKDEAAGLGLNIQIPGVTTGQANDAGLSEAQRRGSLSSRMSDMAHRVRSREERAGGGSSEAGSAGEG
ncbi:hypothetical protein LTS18_014134, partial [Coniosporium uncinatum]